MSKGKPIAVIDAGPEDVSIGELIFEGKKLGEIKIPAGVQAVLSITDHKSGFIALENDAGIEQTDESGVEIRNEGTYVGSHDNYGESEAAKE